MAEHKAAAKAAREEVQRKAKLLVSFKELQAKSQQQVCYLLHLCFESLLNMFGD